MDIIKKIREYLEKETIKTVLMCIKVAVMILLIYAYLMDADLSAAPEFIYNQF